MSVSPESAQVPDIAERLFKLFVGNERRHIKNYGPPVWDKDKNKWVLNVTTHDGSATPKLWRQHLDNSFILSTIPLLDDGTCWFACIDVDEYDINTVEICVRIYDWKLPLIPVRSKSGGLHLFIFFKEPISAERVIPALYYLAQKLGLKKYEIFPTRAKVEPGEFSRGISMPYGPTWDKVSSQNGMLAAGGAMSQNEFVEHAEASRITASELPEAPKASSSTPKIPLYLQAAIDSSGPYPDGDRNRVTASIIWGLFDRGLGSDEIRTLVEHRGPFVRYDEKGRSLKDDIARIGNEYLKRNPNKKGAQAPIQIQSSAEFVTNFTPPDYLIDGIIQRRFVYSMTGPTGEGKTSVALLLALLVDRGWSLDGKEIDKGKVLFLAGENPDDVRMRWIKQLDDANIDPKDINVFFVPGSFAISDKALRDQIMQSCEQNGPFALIIVDTSAAFFEGDDENVNTQMMAHAKMLRGLIVLTTGSPTVIVTSHPVKSFSRENMIPRGGGAFMNEMDGNLTCMKMDGTMVTELHWCGKFRGIDFSAIPFRLEVGKTDKLKDSKGRHLWTVIAKPITSKERDAAEDTAQKNKDQLLAAMAKMPGASLAVLAQDLGWFTKDGKPYKSLVQRLLNALREEKLIKKENGRWVLTKKGGTAATARKQEDDLPF
jgi:hypothetical protein